MSVVPAWLKGTNVGKVLYAVGLHLDGFADMATAAAQYRFPGYYGFDTLDRIGRDRGIPRGRTEAPAVYAERLRFWLDDHRLRAGPTGTVLQLAAFWDPAIYNIAEVAPGGARWQVLPNGSVVYDTLDDWLPLGDPPPSPAPATYWIFLDWPTAATSDGLWDDPGDWTDGFFWDLSTAFDADLVDDLLRVPRAWNAAHVERAWLVLLDGSHGLWDYPAVEWNEPGDTWEASDLGPAQLAIEET